VQLGNTGPPPGRSRAGAPASASPRRFAEAEIDRLLADGAVFEEIRVG